MTNEPLKNAQQGIDETRKIIIQALKELGFSMPLRSAIDTYSGGNPSTKRPGESAAATDELHRVLQSYGWNNPRASDEVIESPIGGGKVVQKLADLPAGKLTTGGYWIVPAQYATTETTFTFSVNAALRIFCPIPLRITKIVIDVTTAAASSNIVVNLYSGDGVELIATSGNIGSTTTGRKTATISAVNITPGVYVVEVTSSDTSVALRATASSTNFAAFSNEVVTTRGTAHALASPANTAAFPWVQFAEV